MLEDGPLITIDVLKQNGYKPYKDPMKQDNSSYLGSWQRKVEGEFDIHYFINVSFYDLSVLDKKNDFFKHPQWSASDQMEDRHGNTIDLSLHHRRDMSLEALEDFFEKTWRRLGAVSYEYRSTETQERHMAHIIQHEAQERELELLMVSNKPAPNKARNKA